MIAQHRNYPPPSRDYATATLGGCFNQQNVNGWTGVPLIRRPRKFSSNGNASHQSSPSSTAPATTTPSIVCPQSTKNYDENTLSKLALQTHGMPLILSSSGRYRNRNFYRNQQPHPNQYMQNKQLYQQQQQQLLQHHNNSHLQNQSSSTSSIHKITENNQNICNKHVELDTNSNSSSSSLSSSSTTDTCLPRIIKPRKRRKKDRKPQTVSTNDGPSSSSTSSPSLQTSYTINNENSNNSSNDLAVPTADNFLTTLQQSSTCYCRLCDPSHRIWAFPLRRSYSDNTPEVELHKTKDVGVIGSNRRPHTTISSIMNQSRTGSFSDDSGIFDFSQNGFGFAESLLTESINEISKKLENGGCDSSSDCSSVFSDAIGNSDLFFNFENLTIASTTPTNSGFNCNNGFINDGEDDDDDGDILLNCLDMVLNSKTNCT
ncbi:hypothetical protein ACFFRR_005994 [Megaselia abdita]